TQALMNRELFRQLFGSAATLGDAVLAAKRAVSDLDVRRTWVLFGDPAMRLNRPPAPAASPVVKKTGPADTSPSGAAAGATESGEAASVRARPQAADVQLADADGDGRADAWFYTPADGRWFAALAVQDASRSWQGTWPLDAQVSTARFNSDRLADLLIV